MAIVKLRNRHAKQIMAGLLWNKEKKSQLTSMRTYKDLIVEFL